MQNEIKLTVVICTYNRAGYLHDTLQDLSEQNASFDSFEVLVINNNSTDGTSTVCEIFEKTNPQVHFVRVVEERQGLSFARNRAVREANSNTLLYIDDDVRLPADYVSTALNYIHNRPSVMSAGGPIDVLFDHGDPDWIPKELMPMFGYHDLGEDDRLYPSLNFPRGGNMIIRKSVFDAFGYFDTELGRKGGNLLGSEEKAFFERLRKNGIELHYWADMKLFHRIGKERLSKKFIRKQSIGIGKSERLRVSESVKDVLAKLFSEVIKLGGSFILALGYLLLGKLKAAGLLIQFRFWVMRGFLNPRKKA
jgi:glycosyltransferase involved in cell wall biosynthesis